MGVGEVIDLRRGFLDPKRLPGVTNGTWLARVKILDPDMHIPPYIIRREEVELLSLNFQGGGLFAGIVAPQTTLEINVEIRKGLLRKYLVMRLVRNLHCLGLQSRGMLVLVRI